MTIPFIDLKTQYRALQPEIQRRINQVLEHGQYIMGPEVKELEERLATYTGAKYCITVSSGTEALLISMMALGIGPGDEVITTPFTFAATAEMIAIIGATPVFVDIEADTCLIDPSKIEAAITQKTRAIMPVSLYGQVCDMDAINAIAAKHGLTVIEDAAQSFGATYNGRQGKAKSCNLSTIGCTSFFPSKPLGCYGDGGAIFTSDENLAQAMREIRVHGQSARYRHTRIGVGGRMDTLQCAIVLAKLDRFDWEINQRLALGESYRTHLEQTGIPVELLGVRPDRDCIWAQYTIMLDQREAVRTTLEAAGIPTAIHYPLPLNRQPAYENISRSMDTPNSELAAKRVMSLPMSPDLQESDIALIVNALKDALQ